MKDIFATLINTILEVAKSYRGDWKESDPSSPNYIKNRTHWIDKKTIDRIVVNDTVTLNGDNFTGLNTRLYLDINGTYYVTFNGIEYTCKPWMNPSNSDPAVYIGNGTIYGGEGMGDLDCPFSIDSYEDGNIYLNVSETTGDYTVQIREVRTEEIIHKLDEKFLPSDNSTVVLQFNDYYNALNKITGKEYEGYFMFNSSMSFEEVYNIIIEGGFLNVIIQAQYNGYPYTTHGTILLENLNELTICYDIPIDSNTQLICVKWNVNGIS